MSQLASQPFVQLVARAGVSRELPRRLRKLISGKNTGSTNDILESAAFAIERTIEAPVTFNDLEKLMRDAITTFRGLEDAAKQVPGLKQSITDLTSQLTEAQKAAGLAKDAQTAAENALKTAQANAIPDSDIQDGNAILDQLATPAATQAVSAPEQTGTIVDGNAASNQ